MVKTKEILTVKRCGILLVVACFVYLVLNIVLWDMNLVTAISGAICATIAFGMLLYFIRSVSKKQTLNLSKVGSKNRVCLPPKLVSHLGIQPKDSVVCVIRTDKNGKNYTYMHGVKKEEKKQNEKE